MSFSGQMAEAPLTDGVTGRRVAAWLVDATLVGVALGLLQLVLWLLGFVTLGLGWFLINGLWVLPLLYTSVFVVSEMQATPGQALMGLVVVRDTDLGRPTPVQALTYAAGFALTMWAGAFWLVAAFFTRRARCLHDIVAGVTVVRAVAAPRMVACGTPIWAYSGWAVRHMTYKPPRRPQFFYTTAPLPCPYVAGRIERKVVTEITGPDADSLHDRLSRAGFRRSHNIAYAPVCPACSACVPIRIDTAAFTPDRGLRRILKANDAVEGFEVPARATAEQFALFQRYQQARHGDGDMATMSFYDYRAMVEDTPIETLMIEFRDPADALIGACLADRLGDGLSAVYSFFGPELHKRSLGTYTILWLIERAKLLDLPYVYLGYWVPESRKMAYKARFRPSEILAGGAWRMLTEADLSDHRMKTGTLLVPEAVD